MVAGSFKMEAFTLANHYVRYLGLDFTIGVKGLIPSGCTFELSKSNLINHSKNSGGPFPGALRRDVPCFPYGLGLACVASTGNTILALPAMRYSTEYEQICGLLLQKEVTR